MLKNKKQERFNLFAVIVNLVLIFSGINLIKNLYSSNVDGLDKACSVFILISLAAAFVYICSGFKKSMAVYYKASLILCSINGLLSIVASNSSSSVLAFVCNVLCYLVLIVLITCENIGKRNSYILCAINVVLRIVAMFIVVKYFGSSTYQTRIALSQLALALMVAIATFAKYIDKDNRGTI